MAIRSWFNQSLLLMIVCFAGVDTLAFEIQGVELEAGTEAPRMAGARV
jgi:hypothetical protein